MLTCHGDGPLSRLVTVFRSFDFKLRNVELPAFRSRTDLRFRSDQHRNDQVGLGCLNRSQQGCRMDRMDDRRANRVQALCLLDQFSILLPFLQQFDLGQGDPFARDFFCWCNYLGGSRDHDVATLVCRLAVERNAVLALLHLRDFDGYGNRVPHCDWPAKA